jgi:acetyl-CoA carboxylase biotin carboxyl carrier protein
MTERSEGHEGMPGVQRTDRADPDLLGVIAREMATLAANLPGALRRMSVTAAGHGVEVEWESRDTGPATSEAAPPATASGPAPPAVPAEQGGSRVVRAPLVGTFYSAPQPGDAPFVSPGDEVGEGDTLAIVEAMKLMNHVSTDCAGRIVEVLARDGEPVEYDQPLMVLETSVPGAPA